ncbi:uncharacterized protein LOC122080034 [Macadamia integrifolia]|uniref:uncharacterized protein LOC122080034 n=1 Tax=Macadamia integrifolia TaxID=60698 RepID=UPI001C4EE49E|nr:uncharacterized protein LOC122080034 [Macadamia integrifolia]
MPCAIRRTKSKIEKVAKGGSRSLSRISLEQSKQKAFSKDREVSDFIRGNSDPRYIIVTFVTLDPDVHCKFVALAPLLLPLQGPDQRNQLGSGPHVKMDGLDLVPPPSAITLHVDPQGTQRIHPPEHAYSTNSLTASSSSGSNFLQHSQTRTSMNKRTKAAKVSGSSTQQNSFVTSDSPALIQDHSNANVSAQQVISTSKINKPAKKNSRKKAKKKRKQFKKPSCSTDSTEPEVLCEEGVSSSSTSESCANNDRVSGVGMISENRLTENAITPVVSLQKITVNINNSGLSNHSATTRVCSSYSSDVNESEAVVPLLPQESTGEHFLVNRECQLKATETLFSTYNGETVDSCLKGTSCCEDASLEIFSDINSTPVLDSFSDGWNSDYSINGGDVEEKSSVREGSGSSPSESLGYSNNGSLLHNARKGCLSRGNCSKGAVDAYNLAERMKSGTHGCSSSDGNSFIPGKRGRQERKLSGQRFSSGCLQGRTGKENNHSVWRKVQRNDADGHLCEAKNVDFVDLQSDTACKEASLLKRGSNASDSDILKSEDNENLKVKVSEKLKKKPSACLKPEFKYHPRNGFNACKTTSNRSTHVNLQQKDASDIPSQVQLNSHCHIECVNTNLQADGVNCIPSERIQTSQGFPGEMNRCGSACTINDRAEKNQNSTSSRSSDSLDKPNPLEAGSPVDHQLPVISGHAKPEADNPPEEYSMPEHSLGSILQKWVPVGRKDADLTSMRIPAKASVSPLEESITDKWPLQSSVGGELSSSCETPLPLMDIGIASLTRESGNISGSLSDDEGRILKTIGHNTCMSSEQSRTHYEAKCVSVELYKDCRSSVFETDSLKIMQAVNDAYRLQLASEAVQFATGSPLADFEKLLHSASPVIAQRYSIQHCQTCLLENVGASLCRHEMPNVSLGGLWQWYEKHGNYGLEVKGEDYLNSKRLGIDRFEFRAYFVPFLSAVQLFSKCRNHPMNNSTGISCPEVFEACEMDEASESSSQIGQDPKFSVLIPKPFRQGGKFSSQPVSLSCLSESSSTHVGDLFNDHSFRPACCDDPELLFEYFESEQPQQRRPLFERVKELVRGGTSNCRAYGDPTVLNSLGLHDLHRSSWYSVAWYPIYRIPDGNFRAAFLTYHSLGHLVHRSDSSDSFGGDNCIVSPVVGLQSYNAQGEYWFHLKETSSSSPSEILKQRLGTLEQTASIMARASVNKGNLKSVNRQPDYEFFLSRRR